MSLTVEASGYTASSASKIKWTIRPEAGYVNPGFKLTRNGAQAKISASKLKKVSTNDGEFRFTVTATDTDKSTASLTITGKAMQKPVISTKKLKNYIAKGREDSSYFQTLVLSSGSEPLEWTLTGDLPSGITFEKTLVGTREYYALTGDTSDVGNFPLTLTVKNDVGEDSKKYTLSVIAVKPQIKVPSIIPLTYDCILNDEEFYIDITKLILTGTKPITLDIDDVSKAAGLEFVSDDRGMFIRGTITKAPANNKLKVQLRATNPFTESAAGGYNPTKLNFQLNIKTPPSGIVAKVPYYWTFGKPYNASFTVKRGSKPITWKFYYYNSYAQTFDTLDPTVWSGCTFSEKGQVKIPANLIVIPEVVDDFYESANLYRFRAEASNIAGDETYDFQIYGGAAPQNINKSEVKSIILTNGEIYKYLEDYGYGDKLLNSVYKYVLSSTTSGRDKLGELKISGLPKGLSIETSYYDDPLFGRRISDYVLTGTLNLRERKDFKKYNVKFEVTNPWGKGKVADLVLDVREPPTIDPNGKLTPEALTAVLGENYKQTVTTNIKKPYTWMMTYKSNDVRGAIGDSGLAWDPEKATIMGKAAKVGSYDVTITLDNESSKDIRTYTLSVVPKTLKITKPKSSVARFVLPEVRHGEIFSFRAEAQGSEPFTWSLEDVPYNYSWNGNDWYRYSSYYGYVGYENRTDWIKVDSETGLIRADNVHAYGRGGFVLDKTHHAYDFTLVVKDNYGQVQRLPVRLPVRHNNESAPKFREDKLYVEAEYDKTYDYDYNFVVPLAISGFPRDNYNVEWKVEGGEKFGITSENILHDGYSHKDINGDDTTATDDGTYCYYQLKVSNLDKKVYDLVGNHELVLTITANNNVGKGTATATITFPPYDDVSADVKSAPINVIDVGNEAPNASDDEISADVIKGGYTIDILQMRDVSDISAKNLAFVSNDDYEIAAVLPEISVDVSGMYEFEVEISEDIEAGRELAWFAFPKNSEPSEDDEIAEFYNSDGEEITTIPENHKITVSAWFNENIIYEPVIAIKKE